MPQIVYGGEGIFTPPIDSFSLPKELKEFAVQSVSDHCWSRASRLATVLVELLVQKTCPVLMATDEFAIAIRPAGSSKLS